MIIRNITRHRGSVSIVAVGITFVILLFAAFFLELQEMYDYQYAIEVRAQRALNSTVEYAMNDRYRSDGFNVMDISIAQEKLPAVLAEDLNLDQWSASGGTCYSSSGQPHYTVSYSNIQFSDGKAKGSHPSIQMTIQVKMYSHVGAKYGIPVYSWSNTYESTNYRTDENARSGW